MTDNIQPPRYLGSSGDPDVTNREIYVGALGHAIWRGHRSLDAYRRYAEQAGPDATYRDFLTC
jgi:hypothetical protein